MKLIIAGVLDYRCAGKAWPFLNDLPDINSTVSGRAPGAGAEGKKWNGRRTKACPLPFFVANWRRRAGAEPDPAATSLVERLLSQSIRGRESKTKNQK